MLVSVIVPVYNVEKYIKKCLDSILNQTYENIELIIVDDGSTDQSGIICDTYSSDNRVHVIHKVNNGQVSARKEGLKCATGEKVIYVDGDDWIEQDTIEKYVEIWNKYDPDIIMPTAHFNDYDNYTDIIIKELPEELLNREDYVDRVFPYLLGEDRDNGRILAYSLCMNAFTKELLEQCQFDVDENIFCGEDGACMFRCIAKSKKIYITNICQYHYVQRSDSTTHKRRINAYNELNSLYINIKEGLRGEIFENELKEKAWRMIHENIILSDIGMYWISRPRELFPYDKVHIGNRIVIYGAGGVGQQIYQAITQNRLDYNIVAWVDSKYDYYVKNGLSVKKPNTVISFDFDYIIVAIISQRIANEITKYLMDLGVAKDKILTINQLKFTECNLPFYDEG